MTKNILILGAGFGGLQAATRLREELGDRCKITLIDKNDFFIIGFSKFDVMFGRRSVNAVKSYYRNIAAKGVDFVQDTIEQIDPVAKMVKTRTGSFGYDFLIVALGADMAPQSIPGFSEGGHEFYTLAGAEKLYPIITNFQSGTVLISIFGKPYKCPPAPYEGALQLHDFFTEKGVRDKVTLKMLIPSPTALPVAKNVSAELEKRMAQSNIELHKKQKVVEIKPGQKVAVTEGGARVNFDLFVGVPLHVPPQAVRESKLGNGGWIAVNPENLETKFENVYAVGDVNNIPVGDFAVPKAGTFAEAAADVVVDDIVNKLTGSTRPVRFGGKGTCYIEFGGGNVAALNADFLGAQEPNVGLDGPSVSLRADKARFESERIAKWFK
ncbi:MAG: FAD-dependent oxidoreductase [Deferribacteres bacterium]|nr:FAD-dependent oxidoreductase [Deferribacteres bacterium]